MRFVGHHVAAKGLLLTAVSSTALLVLLAPTSLASRASDGAGALSDVLAALALLAALVGWADIIWTDILGRSILPSLQARTRHRLCVLLYAALSGWYLIFTFAVVDPRVSTSRILICYYLGVSVFGALLTVAIAKEQRGSRW